MLNLIVPLFCMAAVILGAVLILDDALNSLSDWLEKRR